MASVLSRQTIVGNIGKVYDLRSVGESNQVVDFSVAVTPRKKDGDGWKDGETVWHHVTVWGKLAENVAASLKVGDRVVIIGRSDIKAGYTNRDGVEVAPRPIVIADYVGLELGHSPAESRREGGQSTQQRSNPAPKPAAAAPAPEKASDDLNWGDDDWDADESPF